jgi:hypothetical protein
MARSKGLGDVPAKRPLGAGLGMNTGGLGEVRVAGGLWDDLPPHMLSGSNLGADVGTIPLPMAAGGRSVGASIKAYHGSPHDFDEFRSDKIGTGEGAQAYGHGLYFAEKEGIAQTYRDNLARPDFNRTKSGAKISSTLSRILEDSYDDAMRQGVNSPTHRDAIHLAEQNLARQRADALKAGDFDWFNKVSDQITELHRMGSDAPATKGKMYEVNIKADPEHFLDWDKPLKDQPAVASKLDAQTENMLGFATLQPGMAGSSLHKKVAKVYDDAKASEMLKQAGIPGIKYLDAGSRSAGDGSRNYVVFDPKIIEIVRKYGIGAVLGAGLISEEMAKQMQERGL